MRLIRIIFYVISILVIGEVTDILSLYREDATISFYSDGNENPLEEDEAKELECDDDYFFESYFHLPVLKETISFITPALFFELTEPVSEITVPPPQS